MSVEHRIGEVVNVEGVDCVVVDQIGTPFLCKDCAAYNKEFCRGARCEYGRRTDKRSIMYLPYERYALMRLKGELK